MTKLIRDRLARNISKDDLKKSGKIRLVKDEAEFMTLLQRKLDEEFQELQDELDMDTPDPDRVIEECADLLEVLSAVADLWGSASLGTLLDAMKKKREIKGGFTAGVVLETKEK